MMCQVRMVIASHLSDIQEINCSQLLSWQRLDIRNRLNFCKHLLIKYSDTTIEINAEEEYSEFLDTIQNSN